MNNDEFLRIGNKVNEKITEYLSNDRIPPNLREVMSYSVLAGGKRLRPVLMLSACRACGGNEDIALPFACAIEFIHTYSLIHDDLPALDNDELRRGRKTCHVQFDEARAILAGDGLLSYAFEIMLNNTVDAKTALAAKRIAAAAGVCGMVAGQWVDVTRNGEALDEQTVEYIHKNKTAAMIVGALTAGAALAGANDEQTAALETYGKEIGYTFQIVDDILDISGNTADLGKKTGSDEQNGKTTFVTVMGIERAKEAAHFHTQTAVSALSPLGSNADFLKSLADFLLTRKK